MIIPANTWQKTCSQYKNNLTNENIILNEKLITLFFNYYYKIDMNKILTVFILILENNLEISHKVRISL